MNTEVRENLDAACSPDVDPGGPSRANGDVREAVADAVESLAQRPNRDAKGKFVAGNMERATGLSRSGGFWEAVAPAKAILTEQVRADLGLDGDAPATLDAVIDAFAEASLLRRSLFIRLAQAGGAVTARGRTRAAFAAYLRSLDRETKLAVQLGLQRRPARVSLKEYLDGKESGE